MAMPNCGYGSNKKTKHVMPNGFLKFVVNNVKVSWAGWQAGAHMCRDACCTTRETWWLWKARAGA